MVVQQPSLQHQRWVAIDPHRTPLVLRARGWSASQPAHREQGPVPISSPMKLNRSVLILLECSYVPCNLPSLPGSLRIYGFHILIISLPQGRDKDRWPHGKTHQLSSQVSNIFPSWGNLPLQSYWTLSCDHGLYCGDEFIWEQ